MPTIYISDSGDDKNDGLSLKTPIYSLKQAKKLQGGKKGSQLALRASRMEAHQRGTRRQEEVTPYLAKPLTVAWRSVLLAARCFTLTTSAGLHH
jgi:hypothetical protein